MALQLGALRSALVNAGASEDQASRAAEELAGHENRFARIEADLTVVKWMLGVLIAGMSALLLKAFA